jgi:hypothetical protein
LAVYFVYSPVASNRNEFRVRTEFGALYSRVENVFYLEQQHLRPQGYKLDRGVLNESEYEAVGGDLNRVHRSPLIREAFDF